MILRLEPNNSFKPTPQWGGLTQAVYTMTTIIFRLSLILGVSVAIPRVQTAFVRRRICVRREVRNRAFRGRHETLAFERRPFAEDAVIERRRNRLRRFRPTPTDPTLPSIPAPAARAAHTARGRRRGRIPAMRRAGTNASGRFVRAAVC